MSDEIYKIVNSIGYRDRTYFTDGEEIYGVRKSNIAKAMMMTDALEKEYKGPWGNAVKLATTRRSTFKNCERVADFIRENTKTDVVKDYIKKYGDMLIAKTQNGSTMASIHLPDMRDVSATDPVAGATIVSDELHPSTYSVILPAKVADMSRDEQAKEVAKSLSDARNTHATFAKGFDINRLYDEITVWMAVTGNIEDIPCATLQTNEITVNDIRNGLMIHANDGKEVFEADNPELGSYEEFQAAVRNGKRDFDQYDHLATEPGKVSVMFAMKTRDEFEREGIPEKDWDKSFKQALSTFTDYQDEISYNIVRFDKDGVEQEYSNSFIIGDVDFADFLNSMHDVELIGVGDDSIVADYLETQLVYTNRLDDR